MPGKRKGTAVIWLTLWSRRYIIYMGFIQYVVCVCMNMRFAMKCIRKRAAREWGTYLPKRRLERLSANELFISEKTADTG